jgi:hypothetical protein
MGLLGAMSRADLFGIGREQWDKLMKRATYSVPIFEELLELAIAEKLRAEAEPKKTITKKPRSKRMKKAKASTSTGLSAAEMRRRSRQWDNYYATLNSLADDDEDESEDDDDEDNEGPRMTLEQSMRDAQSSRQRRTEELTKLAQTMIGGTQLPTRAYVEQLKARVLGAAFPGIGLQRIGR